MGTHLIPRADVKGQDRLFIFFSVQGLIGTVIGLAIGYPIYKIMSAFGGTIPGIIIVALLGTVGFVIGQVKLPDTNTFPILKQIGGEYVKDVILRYIKFRGNKKKYVNDISINQNFEVKEDKLNNFIMNKK